MSAVFECKNLHKAYGNKKILKGIDLTLHRESIIGFGGDNGSGKSTLLSILAGVERPDSGKVLLEGQNIFKISGLSERIGYVPQTDPLPPELKTSEILKLWCGSKESYDRTVEEYELKSILKKKTGILSGGMKRRLSFACAASKFPTVMILDEPTAGLDMHFRELIRGDIGKMARSGTAIILVSHDIEDLGMCNKCYRIVNGINEDF
ncbi:MAG: ABC transporter ATP-binding protein [Lachnospiraceae bacterium]|nr:ABC transporter ATP-binding protein [Lachnospiraceae bacterium]